MKNILLAMLLVTTVAGCDIDAESRLRSDTRGYKIVCIDGVQYYSKANKLAAAFDKDTKQVKLCSDAKEESFKF